MAKASAKRAPAKKAKSEAGVRPVKQALTKSALIGLIADELLTSPFATEIMRGIDNTARQSQISVFIMLPPCGGRSWRCVIWSAALLRSTAGRAGTRRRMRSRPRGATPRAAS